MVTRNFLRFDRGRNWDGNEGNFGQRDRWNDRNNWDNRNNWFNGNNRNPGNNQRNDNNWNNWDNRNNRNNWNNRNDWFNGNNRPWTQTGVDISPYTDMFDNIAPRRNMDLNDKPVNEFLTTVDDAGLDNSNMGIKAILDWLKGFLNPADFNFLRRNPREVIHDQVTNNDENNTVENAGLQTLEGKPVGDKPNEEQELDAAGNPIDAAGNPVDDKGKKGDPRKPNGDKKMGPDGKPVDDKKAPNKPAGPPPPPGAAGGLDKRFLMSLRERCRRGQITEEQACQEAEAHAEKGFYASCGVQGLNSHDDYIKVCEAKVAGAGDGISITNSDTEEWTGNCARTLVNGAKASARAWCKKVVSASSSAEAESQAEAPSADVQAPEQTAQTQAVQIKDDGHDDDPITLDLNGDGIKSSGKKAKWDADGDGEAGEINDLSDGDGTLYVDLNGNGKMDDATESFSKMFAGGQYENGFEALNKYIKKFDTNGDGKIRGTELQLAQAAGLRIQKGSYVNGQSMTLEQAGVASISSSGNTKKYTNNFNGLGDRLLEMDGLFTRSDGSTGSYADIFFHSQVA